MTETMIFERISELIKGQLHQEDLDISLQTSLRDDLDIDSIALMEFVISLEDEFALDIPDQDVESIENMGQMVAYLSQRLQS